MVVILTVLFAGDLGRFALSVPVWVAIVLTGTVWAIAVLWTNHVNWRQLPVPFIAVLAWWVVSPLWSPYAANSALMLVPAVITVLIGWALVVAAPIDELVRRIALTLRIVLAGSVLFEIAVAIYGHPVYPVGTDVTASTPIEVAWSRALFFTPGARIQGLVGNANILGMLALVLGIIAVLRLYATRNWRNFSALDVVLSIALISRTSSATVTVAILGIAVVVAITALARRSGLWWRIGTAGSVLVVLSGIALTVGRWSDVSALLGKSPDMTHRFDIWAAVVTRIADQPVIGHGFVGWWPSWDPWFAIHSIDGVPMLEAHNVWLDLMMQTGIVGTILFAITLGYLLWFLWREFYRSPRSDATDPFVVLVALAIQSLTESRILIEWGLAVVVICALEVTRIRKGAISQR
jgi:hypothetical protein